MEVIKAGQYHPNSIQKGQIVCFNEDLRGIGCQDCIDREACMREIFHQQKSKERIDRFPNTDNIIREYEGKYDTLYDLAIQIVRTYEEKKGKKNDREKTNK